jgi:DDE superfamily endonuclease
VVAKRLKWALKHVDWTLEQWMKLIFSGECPLKRGGGGQRESCFHTPTLKWDKDIVKPYKKGKDIRIMIWGSVWIGGRSDIMMMVRDETSSKKRSHSTGNQARSLCKITPQSIPAKVIQEYFESEGISLFPWPPFSPELNPIEHLWHLMKT